MNGHYLYLNFVFYYDDDNDNNRKVAHNLHVHLNLLLTFILQRPTKNECTPLSALRPLKKSRRTQTPPLCPLCVDTLFSPCQLQYWHTSVDT